MARAPGGLNCTPDKGLHMCPQPSRIVLLQDGADPTDEDVADVSQAECPILSPRGKIHSHFGHPPQALTGKIGTILDVDFTQARADMVGWRDLFCE